MFQRTLMLFRGVIVKDCFIQIEYGNGIQYAECDRVRA